MDYLWIAILVLWVMMIGIEMQSGTSCMHFFPGHPLNTSFPAAFLPNAYPFPAGPVEWIVFEGKPTQLEPHSSTYIKNGNVEDEHLYSGWHYY